MNWRRRTKLLMKGFLLISIATALILCGNLQASTATAQTKPVAPQSAQTDGSAAQKYFSDVELLNQDGAKLRFYSDLLKGRTVVIIPFFTTCTSVCPPMNRNMEKIQEALGDRLGKRVFLISISVDPMTDTPERLKEYAAKFHAKPGWSFITGKKENVDWALYKLGQYVEEKNNHTSIMIIGNEATGLWKKAYALSQAAELIKIIEGVAADKARGRSNSGLKQTNHETTRKKQRNALNN
jgi:protein SCO1/2